MKNNFNKAFTLVELIVVITILAVLATVAFISFQGYSTESRDTKRKTDLATISKGLQVYLAANSFVPEPSETKTTVSFSGSKLLTQGYAGKSVLDTLRVQEAQDPIDETFYTYSTNANNTKFQLVGFLENNQTANNILTNNLFADNSNRKIYTIGESVGILLDETNTPIHELGNTTVEIKNNTTVYKTVLNKQNIVNQSGSTLKTTVLGAQKNLYGWRAFDPNCPIDDIKIGDQVWAGCNSTLGGGLEWGQTDENIGTDIFSGSISSCFDYAGNYNPSNPKCQPGVDGMLSNDNAGDWIKEKNKNNDREFNTIWGKMYTKSSLNQACPNDWKVPTDDDFTQLETFLNNSVVCEPSNRYCDGLGWKGNNLKNKNNNLAKALQIPLAGNRDINNTSYKNRGDDAFLWTNTEVGNKLYVRGFYQDFSTIYRGLYGDNFAISVRCIKE